MMLRLPRLLSANPDVKSGPRLERRGYYLRVFLRNFVLPVAVVVVALVIHVGYAAWVEPTVGPTGGTPPPPINTSSTAQTKDGGLNIATTSGRVGIGTASPTSKLHIAGSGGLLNSFRITGAGNIPILNAPWTFYDRSRGTVAAPTSVALNDWLGVFVFGGYDGASTIQPAGITAVVDAAVAVGSVPAALTFRTGPNGIGTERLRISSNGNVSIAAPVSGIALSVAGDVSASGQVQLGNAGADPVAIGAGALYYNTVSGPKYYNGTTWQTFAGGGVPAGTSGQTLRYDSTNTLIANSFLYNDGTQIGIGTTSPGHDLGFGGGVARTIGLIQATPGLPGQNLTINAGTTSSGTDFSGGTLSLQGGVSTGAAGSNITFLTATPGVTGNTPRPSTEKVRITGAGNVGIGTASPEGLQVSGVTVSETARGVDNIRIGLAGGSPRVILEDATFTQWNMDNLGGRLRIFTPGVERFSIDSSGKVLIGGLLSALPGSIESLQVGGPGAGITFADRDGSSPRWVVYPQSGLFRIWQGTNGDRVSIDANGFANFSGAALLASGGAGSFLYNGGVGDGTAAVVLRRDGVNAYIWPWGTGTTNNRVVIGGGGTNPNLLVEGRIGSLNRDPNTWKPSGWGGGISTFDLFADGSVGASQFCLGGVAGGAAGSCISAWPAGPDGGWKGAHIVRSGFTSCGTPGCTTPIVDVSCAAGEEMTGGGILSFTAAANTVQSWPVGANVWRCQGHESIGCYAVCAFGF